MRKNKRSSFLYEFLLLIVWVGSQVFYRRYKIHQLENMPDEDTPTILISNHQNGMMDPVLLCLNNPRPLNFLTRADIFQKSFINKLLRNLNMLPVYRPHDKKTNMKEMNQQTFKECTERIISGRVISLFPEGNHNNRKSLRALKSGILKVTANAWEKSGPDQDLIIMPVGIDYTDYKKFRSDLLIRYGKRISIKEIFDDKKELSQLDLNRLREIIKTSLSEEMIDIRTSDLYHEIVQSRLLIEECCLDDGESDLNSRFEAYKKGSILLDKEFDQNPDHIESFRALSQDYFETLASKSTSEEARHTYFKNESKWPRKKWVSKLLYPIYLLGFALNFIPFYFTENFVKKNIKDPHFISSIRLAVGTFSFVIYFILIFIILGLIWSFTLGFMVIGILFTLGYLALKTSDLIRDVRMGSTFTNLDESSKKQIDEKRDKLLSLIQNLTQ